MAFPTFEPEELIEMIKELLRVDERWMPTEPGTSMYIRPTMIGTRASLGVGPSTEVLLFVMYVPLIWPFVINSAADRRTTYLAA